MTNALASWATWRELSAQPDIWQDWAGHLPALRSRIGPWIAASGATEIWVSGAGTSAYIGDLAAAALAVHSNLPVRAVASTDLVATPLQFLGRGTPLVVSFGRSGDSAESIGVLDVLDALCPQAARLHITCNAQGTLATRRTALTEVIVLPEATHDTGFAMTSSYSTMLLTALAVLGMPQADAALARLPQAGRAALPAYTAWSRDLAAPVRVVFLGSGLLRHAAREAALKVLELTAGQIPALSDSVLGFRHGPKSFMTDDTLVVLFASSNPATARYEADLAAELTAQFPAATLARFGPGGALDAAPDLPDAWRAVLHVMGAQVLAVTLAARMGIDVDDPFAGKGTLTRVVSGVTLYPVEVQG